MNEINYFMNEINDRRLLYCGWVVRQFIDT